MRLPCATSRPGQSYHILRALLQIATLLPCCFLHLNQPIHHSFLAPCMENYLLRTEVLARSSGEVELPA